MEKLQAQVWNALEALRLLFCAADSLTQPCASPWPLQMDRRDGMRWQNSAPIECRPAKRAVATAAAIAAAAAPPPPAPGPLAGRTQVRSLTRDVGTLREALRGEEKKRERLAAHAKAGDDARQAAEAKVKQLLYVNT
jgi:hypothetical protein